MLPEQLRERHDTANHIMDYQSIKPKFNLGEPLMICCLQAIKVDDKTLDKAISGDITGIIIESIKNFKSEPAVLCSGGSYIDIYIKQIRHTNGFDFTKDELIKSGLEMCIFNQPVTFIEWERI